MKKLLKGLMITAFAVSTVSADSNKTFLMPRSQGVNLAMEYTTFNELVNHKNGDFFGAHFQVVPYYMDSTDSDDIGKYFGINDRNNVRLGTGANTDFNYQYMIHDYNGGNGVGTVNLDPELEAYGARIDYYQDLEKILDGLYLKVALPIVHVETDTGIRTAVSTPSTGGEFSEANLSDYFNGAYSVAANNENAQEALEYAKMRGSHSETSVADIDVVLGYKLYEKDNYCVGINLGLTIPVGNDSDGRWVFEPIVGNGDHWAFGGGLDASVKLWKDGAQSIKLTAAANYRYLFEGTERRTLGLVHPDGNLVDWGQYYLAGRIGTNINAQQLRPVANLLTQDVDVEPGSQVDAIAYFTYNNGGWTIDLGYNFFWKEAEDVDMKNAWTDGQYGIALTTQDMSVDRGANFVVSNAAAAATPTHGGSIGALNRLPNNATLAADSARAYGISTSVAETSSIDTHKIFGSAGYIFKDWDYPLMLSLGGAYEFADQPGIANWQILGKFGIKF